MLFRKIIAVYCENHTEHINTLCGQNAEIFNVKACGKYSSTVFQGVKIYIILIYRQLCFGLRAVPVCMCNVWGGSRRDTCDPQLLDCFLILSETSNVMVVKLGFSHISKQEFSHKEYLDPRVGSNRKSQENTKQDALYLLSQPDIVSMVKSRRLRWSLHLTLRREFRPAYKNMSQRHVTED
jgi:hypothetical protein